MPAQQNHNTSSHRLKGSRQKHQNRTRFNPNRYQPEKQLGPESVRQASSLCCRRCQMIIRWKLDYGKYPTLVTIRKTVHCCGICGEKSVNIPFHHICQPCAEEHAVCAKCHLTPEESDAKAMDAIRRGQIQDEDAEYFAQLEANSSDDDGEKEEEEKDEEQIEAERVEKEKLEALEAEHPELLRLKGLDISLIRYNLEQKKRDGAYSLISQQGKLKERERRSALRKLQRGDEKGALELAHKAIAMREGEGMIDDDDEQDSSSDDENDEDIKEVPVKQMTKDSEIDLNKMSSSKANAGATASSKPVLRLAKAKEHAADDTPSDEETL